MVLPMSYMKEDETLSEAVRRLRFDIFCSGLLATIESKLNAIDREVVAAYSIHLEDD